MATDIPDKQYFKIGEVAEIAGARKRLRELGVARALEGPQLDLGLEVDHRARYKRIREELEAIRAML